VQPAGRRKRLIRLNHVCLNTARADRPEPRLLPRAFTVAPHLQIINYRDRFSPIDRI